MTPAGPRPAPHLGRPMVLHPVRRERRPASAVGDRRSATARPGRPWLLDDRRRHGERVRRHRRQVVAGARQQQERQEREPPTIASCSHPSSYDTRRHRRRLHARRSALYRPDCTGERCTVDRRPIRQQRSIRRRRAARARQSRPPAQRSVRTRHGPVDHASARSRRTRGRAGTGRRSRRAPAACAGSPTSSSQLRGGSDLAQVTALPAARRPCRRPARRRPSARSVRPGPGSRIATSSTTMARSTTGCWPASRTSTTCTVTPSASRSELERRCPCRDDCGRPSRLASASSPSTSVDRAAPISSRSTPVRSLRPDLRRRPRSPRGRAARRRSRRSRGSALEVSHQQPSGRSACARTRRPGSTSSSTTWRASGRPAAGQPDDSRDRHQPSPATSGAPPAHRPADAERPDIRRPGRHPAGQHGVPADRQPGRRPSDRDHAAGHARRRPR